MLRGALLTVLLMSAVADAGAQERDRPAIERPKIDSRAPITDSRLPIADGRSPMADGRSPTADEPPPSAYDRARQDGGQTPDTQSIVGQFLKTVLALGLVIAIIWVVFKFGAARLLPGSTGPKSGRLIRVVERVFVDQKSTLLVVDVGSDRMLLGIAEGSIRVLKELGAASPNVDTTRSPAGFRAVLEAITPKKSSEDDDGRS
jgi:flagellar biogenesis protein FliO